MGSFLGGFVLPLLLLTGKLSSFIWVLLFSLKFFFLENCRSYSAKFLDSGIDVFFSCLQGFKFTHSHFLRGCLVSLEDPFLIVSPTLWLGFNLIDLCCCWEGVEDLNVFWQLF